MGIRLSWSLLAIVVIAVFLGGMRGTTAWVERTAVSLTYGAYVTLTVLALVAGRRLPGLLGFVIGGWAYFVPVFAISPERWVERSPMKAAVQALATALVVRPTVPPGNQFEVEVRDGNLRATITGTGGRSENSTVSLIEDRGLGPMIGVQARGADQAVVLTASSEYLGLWQRAVTLGHLFAMLLCSGCGMILAIGFDWYLRKSERSPVAGMIRVGNDLAHPDQPGVTSDQG